MLSPDQIRLICDVTGAADVGKFEKLQSLWSGYGEITRVELVDSDISSVIVKQVNATRAGSQPRGWNTDRSHHRKVQSYQVESCWYQQYRRQLPTDCRTANSYKIESSGDGLQHWFLLEDLDAAGYPSRASRLKLNQAKIVLNWLARFHATFLDTDPTGLWPVGTYWHLETRPDELAAMPRGHVLRNRAKQIDTKLSSCPFQTLVHGDAKVANFCFDATMQQAAAVDFQYVGGGCGMKDVAYFIGSCLDESECERHEVELLDHYFEALIQAIQQAVNTQPSEHAAKAIDQIENCWRPLYPVVWADFNRFLLGWCPGHQKLHRYSQQMTQRALEVL